MIRLLMALHPRSWRVDYGEGLRDLLATGPTRAHRLGLQPHTNTNRRVLITLAYLNDR